MIQLSISELDKVTIIDPAISEKITAARTAIVTVGADPVGRIFLLSTIAKRLNPTKLVDTALDEATRWNVRVIGLESVAYQTSIGHYLEKEMGTRKRYFPITMLKPDRRERKEGRIRGRLHPWFMSRRFYCLAGDFEFLSEYEDFPSGRTCDILDALAYAPVLLHTPEANARPALVDQLDMLQKVDPMSAQYWRSLARKDGKLPEEQDIEDVLEEEEYAGVEGGLGDFYS